MKWKIYYENGSIFSDEDGTKEEAPARGVICIAQVDEVLGRKIETGRDFFVWTQDLGWKRGWTAMNWWGLADVLIELEILKLGQTQVMDWLELTNILVELGIVKFGRMIDNERYSQILARACNDPGLPRKSGYSQEELEGGLDGNSQS